MTEPALQPDPTAVLVAVWRGQHLSVDGPPHVLEDSLGLEILGGAVGQDGPVLTDPQMSFFRGLMVGRARLAEDLLAEAVAAGVTQYVILGAGLDTFAFRHPELMDRLTVFEIDQPGPQRWKQQRLAEMGLPVPRGLRFVPVDFETGQSWATELEQAGLDRSRPAVLAAQGLTQYLTPDATLALMVEAAALGPGSMLICSFIQPALLIEPDERDFFARIRAVAAERGCPFIAEYTPDGFIALAMKAGFDQARVYNSRDLVERYFQGRPDGLRPSSVEPVMVARISPRSPRSGPGSRGS